MRTQKIFIGIGKFVITLGLICLFVIQVTEAIRHAQIRTLNHFMPHSYEDLFRIENNPQGSDKFRLPRYLLYYRIVTTLSPQKAGAHALSGFCYYHLDRIPEAVEAYQRAVALNAGIISHHYNLGFLLFEQKRYDEAIVSFRQAVSLKNTDYLKTLLNSKIYRPIFFKSPFKESEILRERIKAQYFHSYRLLLLSYYYSQNYSGLRDVIPKAFSQGFEKDGVFYYYLGLASFEMKDYERGIYYLKEAIDRQFDCAESFYYLGLCLRELGKEDVAQKVLSQAKRYQEEQKTCIEKEEPSRLRIF